MNTVLYILSSFFLIRVITLFISIYNEKKIIKQGGKQYGNLNSIFLSFIHIVFYASSFYEAYIRNTNFNISCKIGLILLIFAYSILFIVIYQLRHVWTVKIYIVPNHKIVKSFLFRLVKHPNYFLNIVPEIIGVGLLCNAWVTLLYLTPIYLMALCMRIYQEEKAMEKIINRLQHKINN